MEICAILTMSLMCALRPYIAFSEASDFRHRTGDYRATASRCWPRHANERAGPNAGSQFDCAIALQRKTQNGSAAKLRFTRNMHASATFYRKLLNAEPHRIWCADSPLAGADFEAPPACVEAHTGHDQKGSKLPTVRNRLLCSLSHSSLANRRSSV